MDSGGCLLVINSYVIYPIVFIFTIGWILFGGFSDSKIKFWIVLSICLVYLLISTSLGFKYVYNFAKNNSSSKDKKIFVIGIILLIIALTIFFKVFYNR